MRSPPLFLCQGRNKALRVDYDEIMMKYICPKFTMKHKLIINLLFILKLNQIVNSSKVSNKTDASILLTVNPNNNFYRLTVFVAGLELNVKRRGLCNTTYHPLLITQNHCEIWGHLEAVLGVFWHNRVKNFHLILSWFLVKQ